jgi:hypothetical protein
MMEKNERVISSGAHVPPIMKEETARNNTADDHYNNQKLSHVLSKVCGGSNTLTTF